MNALFLLKRIHLEQVGIRFVVAVGLESIKAELFVRARQSRGANGCWWKNCPILGVLRSFPEGGRAPGGCPRLPGMPLSVAL